MCDKKVIVIPIKRNSLGVPNKNRLLINRCLDKLLAIDTEINIVGDDAELFAELERKYGDRIKTCEIPPIESFSDVTFTLRQWRDKMQYSGVVALVQCTSPRLNEKWVTDCFELYQKDKIVVTACEINFKPTALFKKNGEYYTMFAKDEPQPTVARQLLPHTVRMTGAVEVFHTDCLVNDSFFEGMDVIPYMVNEDDSLDIDTVDDLKCINEI